MRIFVAVVLLVLLMGCATPSYRHRTWDAQGNLLAEEVKYDNSTFILGKALGMKIGYDMESYSPVVKIIYGRYESARIKVGERYSSDFRMNDINLFTGTGSASHRIDIGPLFLSTDDSIPKPPETRLPVMN